MVGILRRRRLCWGFGGLQITDQPDKPESASGPPSVVDSADGVLCENCYKFAWLQMLV